MKAPCSRLSMTGARSKEETVTEQPPVDGFAAAPTSMTRSSTYQRKRIPGPSISWGGESSRAAAPRRKWCTPASVRDWSSRAATRLASSSSGSMLVSVLAGWVGAGQGHASWRRALRL